MMLPIECARFWVISRSSPATASPCDMTISCRMVLEACPDIADYSRHGITSWRDFMATAGVVPSMLGISPSAWAEACAAMGEEGAAIMVAAILQSAMRRTRVAPDGPASRLAKSIA